MKYLCKVLLILITILFVLKLGLHILDKGHTVNYSVGNFKIKEVLTVKDNNNYYFELKHEKFKLNFQIFNNYNKSSKVITKINYYKKDGYQCILPIFKGNKILTDIMCLKDNTITYNHDLQNKSYPNNIKNYNKNDYIDKAKIKKLSNTLGAYEDNFIDNHYMAIETYKGVLLLNSKNESINLFDNDVYKKPVSIFTDKYYVVADYNSQYTFKKFYLVNLINGNIKEIRSYDEISFDSIIQGYVGDDIYLFDKDSQSQYKVSIKYESVEKVADKDSVKYYNGKWTTMTLKEALDGKTFDNYYSDAIKGYDKVLKTKNYYYMFKKDGNSYKVYRSDKQNKKIVTYLFNTSDMNIIFADNYIYFRKNNLIYYYSDKGIRKVISNSELEFNNDISFGVCSK